MKLNRLGITAALAILTVVAAQAQTLTQKLAPADLAPTALYGFVTASSQKILAVGAQIQNSVYVYVRTSAGWQQSAELTGSGFGSGVAVSDDTVALTSFGSAFLYKQQNGVWMQQAQIPGASGAIAMQKGIVAAGDGSNAVGVWEQDEFTLAWTKVAHFSGTPGSFTGYGFNLALDGKTLVVAEPFVNSGAGVVHVYARLDSGWTEQAILHPDVPVPATQFGLGLSISGSTIAAGAPGDGPNGDLGGAAYTFVNNNCVWTQQTIVLSPSADSGQDFGTSLSLIGNTLLVGAYKTTMRLERRMSSCAAETAGHS